MVDVRRGPVPALPADRLDAPGRAALDLRRGAAAALRGDRRDDRRPARPPAAGALDARSGWRSRACSRSTRSLGQPQVWALYVLAFLATSFWALGAPALRAMMPGLVPHEQLAASQALQSIYCNVGGDRRARRSAAC